MFCRRRLTNVVRVLHLLHQSVSISTISVSRWGAALTVAGLGCQSPGKAGPLESAPMVDSATWPYPQHTDFIRAYVEKRVDMVEACGAIVDREDVVERWSGISGWACTEGLWDERYSPSDAKNCIAAMEGVLEVVRANPGTECDGTPPQAQECEQILGVWADICGWNL